MPLLLLLLHEHNYGTTLQLPLSSSSSSSSSLHHPPQLLKYPKITSASPRSPFPVPPISRGVFREQVEREFNRIAPELSSLAVYGGTALGPQIGEMRRGVDIIVGTPGRIIDHIGQGNLNLVSATYVHTYVRAVVFLLFFFTMIGRPFFFLTLIFRPFFLCVHVDWSPLQSEIQFCVLDEADLMLQMGFQEPVEEIFKEMPDNKQTTLWSATMPRESCSHHL